LFFCISIAIPTKLSAKDWKTDKNLISDKNLKNLQEKYPNILDATDLQDLLRGFSKLEAYSKIKGFDRGDHWFIELQPAFKIIDIDFDLVTRAFKNQLEAVTRSYLGQVDSEQIRKKIVDVIEQTLKNRGFPKSKIEFNTSKSKEGITYNFKVDYGYPCLFESINFTFDIPDWVEVDIRPGDICDKTVVESELQNLKDDLKDEGYTQASFTEPKYIYNPKSNTAKLLVQGKLGKKIIYKISDKDRRFSITDLFTNDELSQIDPSTVSPKTMQSELRQRYQSLGYDDAEVTGPKIIKSGKDTEIYEYTVNPGVQYKLTRIQFQGATVFSERELIEQMGLINLFESAPLFSIDDILSGIEALKQKYLELGYWNIDIREPQITKNSTKGEANATIFINEGLQRLLSGVRLRHNGFFSDEKILNLFDVSPGEPLSQSKILDFEKNIRNMYIESGFLHSKVSTNIDSNTGAKTTFITLIVSVDEGPRVKIGDIRVIGLVQTHPDVVLRELSFKTGDWYNPERIDSSRRSLLSLGIFQSIQIFPADRQSLQSRSPILDLIIKVRESKPGNVSFGPGWSLYRGNRFSVEGSYNNIAGSGRQVFSRLYLSEEANQKAIGSKTLIGRTVSFGYLEPYILGLPVNGTATITSSARADDKWLLTQSAEIALTHKFRYFLIGSNISSFYGQKVNREESSEDQKEGYLRLLGGSVRVGRFGLRYNWDNRNDITWPTAGFIFASEFSQARFQYGGDLAYNHWKLAYSHYFGITNSLVIAGGFSLAAFQNVDRKGEKADALPQSETLYAGGADSVRGFQERELGPIISFDELNDDGSVSGRSFNNVIGGSHQAVFKLELRQQIITKTLAATIFTDSGNAFFSKREIADFNNKETASVEGNTKDAAKIEDNVPYNFEEILLKPEYIWSKNYLAYGLALNYLTPLGSINFAYGLPWKRCASSGPQCVKRGKGSNHWLLNGQVHINVGASF